MPAVGRPRRRGLAPPRSADAAIREGTPLDPAPPPIPRPQEPQHSSPPDHPGLRHSPRRRHRDQPLTPFRQKGDNTDMTGRTGTTASLGDPRHTPHGFSGGTPTQSPTRITPRNDAATQRSRAVF